MKISIKLLVAKQCSSEGSALGEITGNGESNIEVKCLCIWLQAEGLKPAHCKKKV